MILFLGALLRIAYFLKPRSFWGDEWFTIFLSQNSLKNTILASFKDVHPPLQFIIFHFGGYRFFPLIAGLLSLYFFNKLCKDKLANLIFAISPYFIHLSGETRGYGFLCLFTILVLLGYRWAFPLAIFTEHYGWFLLLAVPFALWFIPFLAGSAALISFQTQAESVFEPNRFHYSFFIILKKVAGLFVHFGGGIKYSFLTAKQSLGLNGIFLSLFILPAVFLFFARKQKYLKLFFIPIIVLMIFYPIRVVARYLPFCAIAYLMLINEGYYKAKVKFKLISNIIISLFLAANIFCLFWMFSVNYDAYHREDYISAAKFIKENIRKDEGLIGATKPLEYYLKEKFPEKGNNIWEVYLGNPDMEINAQHWRAQADSLKKKLAFTRQFGELVWIAKYE